MRWFGVVVAIHLIGCDGAATEVSAEVPAKRPTSATTAPSSMPTAKRPGAGTGTATKDRFVRPPPIGAPGAGDAVDACTQVGGFYFSCQAAYADETDPVVKRYLRRIAEGHGAGRNGYAHRGKAIQRGEIAHAEVPFQCQPDKPCGAQSDFGPLNDPTSCLARAHGAVLMKDPKAARAAHVHACRCGPKEGTFIGYNHSAFICKGQHTPAFIAPNTPAAEGRDIADCAMCHPARGAAACRREIARLQSIDRELAAHVRDVHVPRCSTPSDTPPSTGWDAWEQFRTDIVGH